MRPNLLLPLAFAFAGGVHAQTVVPYCGGTATNGFVIDFAAYRDSLYATGFFTTACGEPTGHLARWDGETLARTAGLLPDAGHSLRVYDDKLYAATYRNGTDSNYLSVWDGSVSYRFGPGFHLTGAVPGTSQLPNLYDVLRYDGQLVVCGEFDHAGGRPIQGIARWNGTRWDSLGGGLSGSLLSVPLRFPHVLLEHDGDLYVGGNFTHAGGVEANGVARWDGSQWHAVGTGFNSTVLGLAVWRDTLYAGGDFSATGGGVPVDAVARWNGSAWESPGFGFRAPTPSDYTFLHTFAVIGDRLWMLGGLQEVLPDGGAPLPCGGVVAWDGRTLETFGGGVADADLEAVLEAPDGRVLLGGGGFGTGWLGAVEFPNGLAPSATAPGPPFAPNPAEGWTAWTATPRPDRARLLDAAGRVLRAWSPVPERLELGGLAPGLYRLAWDTPRGPVSAPLLLR
jgi:hypothetical protein